MEHCQHLSSPSSPRPIPSAEATHSIRETKEHIKGQGQFFLCKQDRSLRGFLQARARKPRAGDSGAVAGGQCGGSQKAWGSNVAPRQLCEAGRATDPSASQLPR